MKTYKNTYMQQEFQKTHAYPVCIEHALDTARCMQLLHGILHCSHAYMSGMRACQACMSSLELKKTEPEMLLHRSGGPL